MSPVNITYTSLISTQNVSPIPPLLGIVSSTVFSAGNLVIIYHALPGLLLSYNNRNPTPPLTHLLQWRVLFHRDHYTFPGSVILAASAFFHAGRQLSADTRLAGEMMAAYYYYAAAALALAVIPFTLIFVVGTNAELERRAALVEAGTEEKRAPLPGSWVEACGTVDLIRWWGTLGVIRAMFPLMAIMVAAAAWVDATDLFASELSAESAALFLGMASFVFLVVRFGLATVEV
jgi:Domain of unknown function (DUF1772)